MKWLLNSIIVLLIGYILIMQIMFPSSPIKTEGKIRVEGLKTEVKISRDENGIPTIEASNPHDLFFAQGFIHCQERFFQMDIYRRAAQGRLSELLGEKTEESDRITRALGINLINPKLSSEERVVLQSYTDGVNACLKTTGSSFEYKLLMAKREPWSIKDSLSVERILQWSLSSNFSEEFVRYEILSEKAGLSKFWNILDPVSASETPFIIEKGENWLKPGEGIEDFLSTLPKGMSNNWVISGKRTKSGKPILANDPHLEPSLPGIWYLMHLKGGGYDVMGVSLPGTPGIIIGRNSRIAWGFTNSYADVQDLYIIKIKGDKYWLNGEEKRFKKRKEFIKIRGNGEKKLIFFQTDYGPVIYAENGKGLVLRWVGYKARHLIKAMIALNRAKDWEDFRRAMSFWTVPSQNTVYADIDGNIGYQLNGKIPKRNWSGLFPVKKGNWEGYYSIDELPHSFNPGNGYIVTANNYVEPDFPGVNDALMGYRAERIRQMIEDKKKISLEDIEKIQMDVKSLYAQRLIKAVLPILEESFPEDPWVKAFKKWDYRISANSTEAALFEVFVIETEKKMFFPSDRKLQALYLGKLPGKMQGFSIFSNKAREALLRIIEGKRDDVVRMVSDGKFSSVNEVVKEGFKEAKSMAKGKTWGKIHYLELIHPLGRSKILKFLLGKKVYLGKFPMGGDRETVLQASSPPLSTSPVLVTPSMREIIDFSDDRWISFPGQTGIPSKHYSDLLKLWLNGEYITIGMGRKKVILFIP